MNGNEMINALNKGIDMVAKKLGVTANKIYPILQKQVKYDLYMDIFWTALFLIALIATVIVTKKYIKSLKTEGSFFYNDSRSAYSGATTFLVGLGLGLAYTIIIIVLIYKIHMILQISINPDWYIFTHYIRPLIGE